MSPDFRLLQVQAFLPDVAADLLELVAFGLAVLLRLEGQQAGRAGIAGHGVAPLALPEPVAEKLQKLQGLGVGHVAVLRAAHDLQEEFLLDAHELNCTVFGKYVKAFSDFSK